MRRLPPALLLLLGITLAVRGERTPTSRSPRGSDLILVPFAPDAVRHPGVVDAALLIVHPSLSDAPLQIEAVEVELDGILLHSIDVDSTLAADRRYVELNSAIELLPPDLSELHRPRAFAAEETPPFTDTELPDRLAEIQTDLASLRATWAQTPARPFVEVHLPLALDQVFAPGERPGTLRTLTFRARGRDASGTPRSSSVPHSITLLAPFAPAPRSLGFSFDDATLHAGDLHVHSCHGEAANACAPSSDCDAESFQTSGSFSYAQLKGQYQALGVDWITATDHSYCINSASEYATIVAECAALTDGAFLCVPDTELSSDEQGTQSGSDLADLLCLLGPAQNHMGAHSIATRKPGGGDGFLGFCNGLFSDALEPFTANVAAVRAEGGYPIVNHPTASSFAWNSTNATLGIESDALHGVEIWNGSTPPAGQGGAVASWVDWLLGGRILYAYSGSDTHDSAFAFGTNQAVFLDEPFDAAHLHGILERGRVFVTNGPALVLECDYDGLELLMGALQSLPPAQPASTLSLRAHYDLGSASGSIMLFRGRVGDAAETPLAQSGVLTGSGEFTINATLEPASRTWYRAYLSANAGTLAAYTNPVFFLPSSAAWTPYGTGLGGANIASLASTTSPAIGTLNRLDLGGFSGASALALLVFSSVQLPSGLPFKNGFLLVSPPFAGTYVAPLSGGSGELVAEVPYDLALVGHLCYWQAAAIDTTLPGRFAFTNGLTMPIVGLLQ